MSMNFEFSEVLPDSFEYVDGDFPVEMYSNANADYGAIAQGVGAVAGAVGGVIGKRSEKKTAQEMSKTDVQREIDARCGKDKSKSWIKSKKNAYLSCRQDVIKKYDIKQQEINTRKEQQNQLSIKVAYQKQKQKNMLQIGAVILVAIGVVIYLRNKSKKSKI